MRGIQQEDLQPERPFFHMDLNKFVSGLHSCQVDRFVHLCPLPEEED